MDYFEPEHNIHGRFSGAGASVSGGGGDTSAGDIVEFTAAFSDDDHHFKSFRKFNLENDRMIPIFNEVKLLKSKLHEVEYEALELEREWVSKRFNLVKTEPLCTMCNLDECKPGQRKMIELMKFHQQLLNNKPMGYLCMKGIFGWISESLLDTKEGTVHHEHSRHCHQVANTAVLRSQLLAKAANFLQIRRPLFGTECTLEKPCVTCLDYVLSEISKYLSDKYEVAHTKSHSFPLSPSLPQYSKLEKQWNEKFNIQEDQIHFLKECVESEVKGETDVLTKMNETVESLLASERDLKNEVQSLFKMNCELKQLKEKQTKSPQKTKILKMLTPFSGFVWESAEHSVDKWQQELKSMEVPAAEWIPTVVDQGLHGVAHVWWLSNEDTIMLDTSLNYWDTFTESFTKYFTSKIYQQGRFHSQCKSLLSNDDFGDDEALKLLKAFRASMGDEILLTALYRNSGHHHRFHCYDDIMYAFYDKKDYSDYYLRNKEFWAKMLNNYTFD